MSQCPVEQQTTKRGGGSMSPSRSGNPTEIPITRQRISSRGFLIRSVGPRWASFSFQPNWNSMATPVYSLLEMFGSSRHAHSSDWQCAAAALAAYSCSWLCRMSCASLQFGKKKKNLSEFHSGMHCPAKLWKANKTKSWHSFTNRLDAIFSSS
jgi:hypothetical protein